MGFLAGKRAFIVGVATDRSIAWGIAQALHREGAELAFSYVNDKMKERVEPLAHSLGSRLTMPLDVTVDAQSDAAFERLGREWGELDILVHAVAYAPREALTGTFIEATRREGFRVAHEVSSYSLTALAQRAQPLMAGRRGALLTLTYLGAVRSIPGYNVMGLAKASLEANVRFLAADLGPQGVRVNAISAGPIKTLAAAGIPGFRKMLSRVAEVAPLRRNVTLEDGGNAAAVRTAVTATTAAPPSPSASARNSGLPAGRGAAKTASRTGAGIEGSRRPTKCAGSAGTLSSCASAWKDVPPSSFARAPSAALRAACVARSRIRVAAIPSRTSVRGRGCGLRCSSTFTITRRSSPSSTGPPTRPTASGGSANRSSCSAGAAPSGGAPAPLAKLATSPVSRAYCCAREARSAPGSVAFACSCS